MSKGGKLVPLYLWSLLCSQKIHKIPPYNNTVDIGRFGYLYPRIKMTHVDAIGGYNTYREIFQKLHAHSNFVMFNVASKDDPDKYIYIGYGTILDDNGNILLIYATDSDAIKNIEELDTPDLRNELDEVKKTIFIASEFERDPLYKNVMRKIKSDIIPELWKKDYVIITMPSKQIDKELFQAKVPRNLRTLDDVNFLLEEKSLDLLISGITREQNEQ